MYALYARSSLLVLFPLVTPPPYALESEGLPRGTENARSLALPHAVDVFLSSSSSISRDVVL